MSSVEVGSLTRSQQGAYLSEDARTLILGGPGTGKTTVALLIARRIVEREPAHSVRRVLFLTFSRSATAELAARAPRVVAGELGRRIDISTFHAFALEMLNAFGRFAGRSVGPIEIQTREEQKLGLASEGALTFDDVIPSFVELLRSAPWLKSELEHRYAAIICDEYQDTGQPAADLVDALASECRLICLADADQVIFDFTDDTITQRIAAYQASGAVTYDLGYDSRRDPSNVIPRAASAIRRRAFGDETIAEACQAERIRVVTLNGVDPFRSVADQVKSALRSGARDIGVFFATNRTVNDFAERLRHEQITHEIVGLSSAAGEAQVACATLARFVVGAAEWTDFLVDLGVFVAACYRGQPPPLAVQLVQGPSALDRGLAEGLTRERANLRALNGQQFEQFLSEATGLWGRRFVGRPTALWEQGLWDLRGQTIELRRRALTEAVATALTVAAARRRRSGLVDDIPARRAPVRLMNTYQVKGREMDDVLLVHLPDDRDEWDRVGMLRLSRVHYVALSRGRRRATIMLAPTPKSFFAPYAGLCSQT